MKQIEQLITILEQNADLYERLAEESGRERSAVQDGSLDELGEIVKTKETVVLKLKMVDEARRNLLGRIAKRLNVSSSKLTISYLAGLVENAALKEKLLDAGGALEENARRVRNCNEFNSRLINRAMETVIGSLQFTDKAVEPSETYSSRSVIDSRLPSGRLVERAL